MDRHTELLKHLEDIKKSKKLVIVEGKKDKKALEKFGIFNIITLSKQPLYHVIEEVASNSRECIILTDLDSKGKELYGKLNSGLQQFGIKVDNTFREFLFKETKLRQIEGLISYLSAMER
ncbi:toprim domain-containing protein [Candidatus Woesearchaeota archaeon]|nr:toprim domain-containing protein [Candidatus Woesearchaeota archaeon]